MGGGDEVVGNGGLEGVVNLLDMDGCLVYLWVSDKFMGNDTSQRWTFAHEMGGIGL